MVAFLGGFCAFRLVMFSLSFLALIIRGLLKGLIFCGSF